jgi:hypothetical protein
MTSSGWSTMINLRCFASLQTITTMSGAAGAAAAHNNRMCAGARTLVRAFARREAGQGEKDEGKAKTAQTSAQGGKS